MFVKKKEHPYLLFHLFFPSRITVNISFCLGIPAHEPLTNKGDKKKC